MRSRYNSGCPLCQFGHPSEGLNPLGDASSASASNSSTVARSGTGRGIVTGVSRPSSWQEAEEDDEGGEKEEGELLDWLG